MRATKLPWATLTLAVAGLVGLAGHASAAELIANGGFEAGVRTDTQNGNTNPNAPVDWSVNAAFDSNASFNQVSGGDPHSGALALQFADYNANPVVSVSQSFADVAGANYLATFYVRSDSTSDPVANFNASIDGATLVSTGDSTVGDWTQETFGFQGSGSDTLAFSANTNPGEWHLDDVSVSGPAATVSAAPEPGAWALMLGGVGMLGVMLRMAEGRRREDEGRDAAPA